MRDFLKRLDPRLLVVVLLAALLTLLLLRHTSWLNGPAYWKWPWQQLDPLRTYPLLLLAALPFFAAQWLHSRRTQPSVLLPLLLVMLANLALQIAALGSQSDPFSLERIAWIVEHPLITSYFTDAGSFTHLRDWLGSFPEQMRSFHLHAVNKPPGPVLYYVLMMRTFGDSAAHVGGTVIGVLATTSIPATFLLIRTLGGSREAAFAGASFLALCPGPVLFFPEFDQLYAPLICLLIALWVLALKRNSAAYAAGFGAVLFALTFFSFGLLVIGLFLALLTLDFLAPDPRGRVRGVARGALIGAAVVATAYLLLWWITGYDPWATFATARSHQAVLSEMLQRPYPQTILFDLTDFALGTGWISFLLVVFFLTRKREAPFGDRELRVAAFCLGQVIFVGAAGLIPTETARVWIFMIPLLMFPVGVELSRWPAPRRVGTLACLWLLMAAVHQNLVFISG